MNKENRKKAQEQRAKERLAQERRKKQKRWIAVIVPIIICVAAIGFIAYSAIQEKKSVSENLPSSTSSTNATSSPTAAPTKILSTSKKLAVKNGDTINIDYVGTIHGKKFSGGDTQGKGTSLTIGSHTYIDTFEKQLIGHHVGDTVRVKVTFPKNYGSASLANKKAVFKTKINGIYQ